MHSTIASPLVKPDVRISRSNPLWVLSVGRPQGPPLRLKLRQYRQARKRLGSAQALTNFQ
jgi:hypothetical protein